MCRLRLFTILALFVTSRTYTQDFFAPGTLFPVSTTPTCLAIGDLNNDGTLDLVTGGIDPSGKGKISILYGRGDGGFSENNNVNINGIPADLQILDIDKDGLADIVVVSNGSQTITSFINETHGQFKEKESDRVKGEPGAMGLGDFNKDGSIDLVISTPVTKEIHVYKGNGKGVFKFGATKVLDNTPSSIRVNDFVGNGLSHVLVEQKGSSSIALFAPIEKSGKWEFTGVSFDMRSTPMFAKLADMDGDGVDDAVSLNAAKGEVTIKFGDANGLFLNNNTTFKTVPDILSYVLGDFNRDGKIDLAVLNPDNAVIVYLNQKSTAGKISASEAKKLAIIYSKDDSKPNTADVGILPEYKSVSMLLYDNTGKLVRKYFQFDSDLPEGQFNLEWTGTDENDNPVADGNYVFYYKMGSLVITRTVKK